MRTCRKMPAGFAVFFHVAAVFLLAARKFQSQFSQFFAVFRCFS